MQERYSLYMKMQRTGVRSLSGKKLLNGFIIGNLENRPNAWNDTQNNIVSWKMKYDERYKIHIRIETNNGPVYMFYTPSEKSRGVIEGKKNTYIHHGLGRATKNGQCFSYSGDRIHR